MQRKHVNLRKIFGSGIVIGCLGYGAVGYAASNLLNIQVSLPHINFVYNGELKNSGMKPYEYHNGREYVPLSINYKGTTYVPARYVSDLVNKNVEWDPQTKSVRIDDKPSLTGNLVDYSVHIHTNIPSSELSNAVNNLPSDLRQWYEDQKRQETASVKEYQNNSYLLITRGEKPNEGYRMIPGEIIEMPSELLVKVFYEDPDPNIHYEKKTTHPALLIQLDKPSKKKVRFEIIKPEDSPQIGDAPEINTGYTYTDEKFTVRLPKAWKDKIKVEKKDNETHFYYQPQNPSKKQAYLFGIDQIPKKVWDQGGYADIGFFTLLGTKNDIVYALHKPGENPYAEYESSMEYQDAVKMLSVLKESIQFNLLP